jgi:YCII-related domain
MPTYLITYHGGPGMPTDPEAAQQMLAAFQAWVGEVGSAMRDPGAPLAAAKTVSADSETDGQAEAAIGGYTLVEAASLDEAAQLVRSHPFLARGGSLQVSESVSVGA